MCKLCLCGLGQGALESLNKQDNNSSDAIEEREFVVQEGWEGGNTNFFVLGSTVPMIFVERTWNMLKAAMDKGWCVVKYLS